MENDKFASGVGIFRILPAGFYGFISVEESKKIDGIDFQAISKKYPSHYYDIFDHILFYFEQSHFNLPSTYLIVFHIDAYVPVYASKICFFHFGTVLCFRTLYIPLEVSSYTRIN